MSTLAAGDTEGAGGNNNSSSSGNGGGARIKSAAAALLKGGTLVGEPCRKCGGVQVRTGDITSCINCGNEAIIAPPEQEGQKQKAETQAAISSGLGAPAGIIEHKISELALELRDEKDTAIQRQKAELLEAYLRILEKMRGLAAK